MTVDKSCGTVANGLCVPWLPDGRFVYVAFGCQTHDYKIVSMSENVSQKHRSSPEKGYVALVIARHHARKARTLQDLGDI